MIAIDRQHEDQRREIVRGQREHRQREAQEAVAAHLQQDAARITEPAVGASTCASGSQVCTGHIGTLTANEAKKASHSQACMAAGNGCHQRLDVGGTGVKYMARIASSISTEPSSV